MTDTTRGAPAALLLASRSPRRAELLRTLGVAFRVIDVEVDETTRVGEAPVDYVRRLARDKARAGQAVAGDASLPVLAADTTVVLDGAILGKPLDDADARAMLARLAGRTHEVLTGVAVIDARGWLDDAVVATRVSFRALSPAEIAAYVASGEPADKAGAYGIQGLGGALVERIDGSYSNVVGLPLVETLALLDAAGVPHALRPVDLQA
jgi:septum formation protein